MTEIERRENEKTNYYMVLELDFRKPEVSKDTIKRVFENKCVEWSSLLNNPQKRRDAQSNQDITSKSGSFERIMLAEDSNSQDRLEEANAAVAIADKKLKELVNSFCGIKNVKASDIKRYIDNNKKYMLNIEHVKKVMKAAGVTVEEDASSGRNINPFTDIAKDLDVVGKKTIYEFLFWAADDSKNGIKKTDGTKWKKEEIFVLSDVQIGDICDKVYARYNAIAQKTERNNAVKKLAMSCKKVFSDKNMRKQYDDFISNALPDVVLSRIDIFGLDSSISLEEATDLIELYSNTAEGKKLSLSEIKENLKKEFIVRKIFDYEFPNDNSTSQTFKRCRICGTMSKVGNTHCPECGNAYTISCFKCGEKIENGIKNCPKCGTDLGGKQNAELECRAARKCLDKFDFKGALECIQRAKRSWADYKEIIPLEKEIMALQKEMQDQIDKINISISKKHYVEAKNTYEALKSRISGYKDSIVEQKIGNAIKEAMEWLNKAKNCQSNESQLIDYCAKAIEICDDLQEAKILMIKYPPKSATNLKVVQNESSNLISWDKSTSTGAVTYCLLKGIGAIPKVGENNVKELTVTSSSFFEDKEVMANVPTFYSVYTYRAGISTVPIYNEEPLFNYLNVENARIEEGNGCLTLYWEKNNQVDSVVIFRKEGSPVQKYGDGTLVETTKNNMYTDVSLTNEQKYYYGIFAQYRTAAGLVTASGEYVSGIPTVPPEKVTSNGISKGSDTYTFSWIAPSKGTVEVMMIEHEPRLQAGLLTGLEKIKEEFLPLGVVAKTATSVQFKALKEGVFYICPITVVGKMGVIGDYHRISSVADFSDLQTPRISGNTGYISFAWSCKAKEAIVLCKTGGYPYGPEDSTASKVVISKEVYEKETTVVFHNLVKDDYYFTVYASYGAGIYSAGISTFCKNGTQDVIVYKIEVEKNLFKKVKGVRVYVESDTLHALPNLLLYKKMGVQPLNKGDGTLVGKIESVSQNKTSFFFNDTIIGDKTKFQLFFDNDELYNKIILRKR